VDKKITALTMLILFAINAQAVSLLDINPDGRSAAMGEATSPLSEGAIGMWNNPAGLAAGNFGSAAFGSHKWIADVTGTHIAGSLRVQEWGVGVTVRSAGTENLEARETPILQPQGTFGVRESDFGFGLARNIGDKFRVGANSTYRYSRIEDDVANQWLYGFGAQYQAMHNLHTGLSMQYTNGGNGDNKGSFVPNAGLEYDYDLPAGAIVSGAADLRIEENKMRGGVGAEFTMLHMLSVRGGYQFGYDSQGISYGVGACWKQLKISLGIVPFSNDLGTTTRVSVEFGS